jgi:phosphomannomutase
LAKIPDLRYGYEEALGYAVDAPSVNDKDGISAALMIAQCAGELKAEGRSMADYLNEIWSIYGFHATEQISIRVQSIAQVDRLLAKLRKNPTAIDWRFRAHPGRRPGATYRWTPPNKWAALLVWRESTRDYSPERNRGEDEMLYRALCS